MAMFRCLNSNLVGKFSQKANKVNSFTAKVGQYYAITSVQTVLATQNAWTNAIVITSAKGPAVTISGSSVDSVVVIIKATNTNVSATQQFGYIAID